MTSIFLLSRCARAHESRNIGRRRGWTRSRVILCDTHTARTGPPPRAEHGRRHASHAPTPDAGNRTRCRNRPCAPQPCRSSPRAPPSAGAASGSTPGGEGISTLRRSRSLTRRARLVTSPPFWGRRKDQARTCTVGCNLFHGRVGERIRRWKVPPRELPTAEAVYPVIWPRRGMCGFRMRAAALR